MTVPAALFLIAFVVAAIFDWNAVALQNRRLEFVAKPAATALLLLCAAFLDATDPARKWWFVVALAFSLAGDVFLMLPARRFVAGLVSFLIAHVCYIIGFLVDAPREFSLVASVVVVLTIAALAAVPLVNGVRRGRDRALLGPVLVYMTVISLMVGTAVSTGIVWAIVGAAFFFVSDYLIGWDRFVADGADRRNDVGVVIMATYHVGQLGLVVSLLH